MILILKIRMLCLIMLQRLLITTQKALFSLFFGPATLNLKTVGFVVYCCMRSRTLTLGGTPLEE